VKAKHLRDEAAAGMKGASDVLAKTETEAAPRSKGSPKYVTAPARAAKATALRDKAVERI
jgi:hypothetical protein